MRINRFNHTVNLDDGRIIEYWKPGMTEEDVVELLEKLQPPGMLTQFSVQNDVDGVLASLEDARWDLDKLIRYLEDL
jgi:hypothetical protein